MRNLFPCHQEKVVTCTVRCNNYNPLWSPYSLTLELEMHGQYPLFSSLCWNGVSRAGT